MVVRARYNRFVRSGKSVTVEQNGNMWLIMGDEAHLNLNIGPSTDKDKTVGIGLAKIYEEICLFSRQVTAHTAETYVVIVHRWYPNNLISRFGAV